MCVCLRVCVRVCVPVYACHAHLLNTLCATAWIRGRTNKSSPSSMIKNEQNPPSKHAHKDRHIIARWAVPESQIEGELLLIQKGDWRRRKRNLQLSTSGFGCTVQFNACTNHGKKPGTHACTHTCTHIQIEYHCQNRMPSERRKKTLLKDRLSRQAHSSSFYSSPSMRGTQHATEHTSNVHLHLTTVSNVFAACDVSHVAFTQFWRRPNVVNGDISSGDIHTCTYM